MPRQTLLLSANSRQAGYLIREFCDVVRPRLQGSWGEVRAPILRAIRRDESSCPIHPLPRSQHPLPFAAPWRELHLFLQQLRTMGSWRLLDDS